MSSTRVKKGSGGDLPDLVTHLCKAIADKLEAEAPPQLYKVTFKRYQTKEGVRFLFSPRVDAEGPTPGDGVEKRPGKGG